MSICGGTGVVITFEVRNQNYRVAGKTKNFWTVRPEGDELKIVAIHEQRQTTNWKNETSGYRRSGTRRF